MMAKKFLYEGSFLDRNDRNVYDKDVYKLILKHSRFIDRLSNSKMVEMSLFGHLILLGDYDLDPDDLSWKFYGKHSKKFREA